MLTTSLIHGGPAPHLFSEAVSDFILHGMDKVRVTVNDVDVRSKLIMVGCVHETSCASSFLY